MRHFVKQLRKKPAHIKERIALGTTFVGTMVLVFFWVTIVRFEILPKQKLAESKSPFKIVGSIFQNAYKGTVASVGSIGADGKIGSGEGKLLVVPQEDIFKKDNEEDLEESSAFEENNLEINQ